MLNNKKIITIPDIHGSDYWKYALEKSADLYVFLGDYCDSFHETTENILNNFMDILNTKKEHPNQVELLIGNHELHYFLIPPGFQNYYHCSGYRDDLHNQIYPVYMENKNLFKIAHQEQNYLWTHAGVSDRWYNERKKYLTLYSQRRTTNIEKQINSIAKSRHDFFLFEVGRSRGGSKHNIAGPLWADLTDTMTAPLIGMHQIVGHTPVKHIKQIKLSDTTSITYCDTAMYNRVGPVKNYKKEDYIFYELNISNIWTIKK